MKLRGHHIFCTRLFSGHGYDQAFAENMGRIIEAGQSGEPLRVCTEQDAVCAACPNRQPDGGCELGSDDVLHRDLAALKVLRLSPGQELAWEQAKGLLRGITEEDFAQVCSGCRWAKEGLCSYQLLMERVRPADNGLPSPGPAAERSPL